MEDIAYNPSFAEVEGGKMVDNSVSTSSAFFV